MLIAAVNGSHNKNGNTAFLLNLILKECEKLGAQTCIISAHEAVSSAKTPFCLSCSSPCNKSCYKGTYLDQSLETLSKADAIIYGSPVYFGSMSGQLKCFFDKTRDARANKSFIGKIGCAVTVGGSRFGGQESTIRAIHDAMLVDGMTLVGGGSYEFDAGHLGVCAQKPAENDENAIKRAIIVAHRLVDEINSKR